MHTAAAQDVVDTDLGEWQPVWHRLRDLASTPWKQGEDRAALAVVRRPPPTP
jgi:hypothetical protein